MNRNKIINDLLRLIGITVADGEHLCKLKDEAEETTGKYGCTFEIGRAIDYNKQRAESIWSALGEACNFDLRAIMVAVEEKLGEEEQENQ